jgi:serine/threonine protein kinase
MSRSQLQRFPAADLQYNTDDDWIGAGAFGDVYRCRLPTVASENVVAVKVISSPRRLKEHVIRQFTAEVNALHQLAAHPNIIQLLGFCTDPGHYCVVMEFAEKGSLEDLLQSISEHPEMKQWQCRIKMGLDVTKGMNFLHSQEPPITHRNLKTANVLVGEQYCCKVRRISRCQ